MKDLTSENKGRSTTVQDKSGKCLTEEQEILRRWTEYCSKLYNCGSYGDNTVPDCKQLHEEDLQLACVFHYKESSYMEYLSGISVTYAVFQIRVTGMV